MPFKHLPLSEQPNDPSPSRGKLTAHAKIAFHHIVMFCLEGGRADHISALLQVRSSGFSLGCEGFECRAQVHLRLRALSREDGYKQRRRCEETTGFYQGPACLAAFNCLKSGKGSSAPHVTFGLKSPHEEQDTSVLHRHLSVPEIWMKSHRD